MEAEHRDVVDGYTFRSVVPVPLTPVPRSSSTSTSVLRTVSEIVSVR
jgi:hypothetical protein